MGMQVSISRSAIIPKPEDFRIIRHVLSDPPLANSHPPDFTRFTPERRKTKKITNYYLKYGPSRPVH